ncbi:MAG: OsmC family protein [Armatimonadetes bacterium]|jgi:putative redox protein|nr:OsmC family protein [Armatimonadota bacterium]
MNASVVWTQDLSFTGTADSGFHVPLGAAMEAGGGEDGFRPMELLLVGLAGCTAMDVIAILRKQRQEVTSFEVKVRGERAANHPRVFTTIELEYHVRGRGINRAAVEKAIALSETKYCSAIAMLRQSASVRHRYQILEE